MPPRPAHVAFSAPCRLGLARLGCPRALCAHDLPGRFRDFLLGLHPDGLAYRVLPLPWGGNRSAPICGGNASFPHSLARTRRCGMRYPPFRLRPQHDAPRWRLLQLRQPEGARRSAPDGRSRDAGKRREGSACRLVRYRLHQPDVACLSRHFPNVYGLAERQLELGV